MTGRRPYNGIIGRVPRLFAALSAPPPRSALLCSLGHGPRFMPRPSKADAILDATEALSRQRGFSGFAIRDVAEEVGVRSAAVHYHFPSKEQLVVAAMQRYAERFFEAVGTPESDPELRGFVAAFRATAFSPGTMCLCGVMAGELDALPPAVGEEVHAFFTRMLIWTNAALVAGGANAEHATQRSVAVVALLEGAMLTARALSDAKRFDQAAAAVEMIVGATR